MTSAYPIRPADEAHRLEALRPYQLITAISDPLLDEVIRLTASLFSAPIAIVALVEKTTVQFRLNVGLPEKTEREPRDESICSAAILSDKTTVYENLLENPCELVQPALIERLNLQFYAGHPLCTPNGQAVGMLCVLDHQPRPFGEEDRLLLARLANLVMQMLNLRLEATYNPVFSSSQWGQLYDRIEHSMNRLATLTALAKWEQNTDTPGAVSYRESTRDEISRVLDALQAQITTAA